MISKEKSKPASRQKLISQNNKRKSVSNTKINIFSEPKKTIIQNILLNIPLYLKKYFIYRHYSFNQYINNLDYRENLNRGKINYERQVNYFKTQISIGKYLKRNIYQKEENSKGPKKFLCLGGYKDIINNLKERGWIQQTNPNSMDYNYAWTLKTIDIKFLFLKPYQLVNHFTKNGAVTRKNGLCKNLRNLYFKNINPDNFYPRCYDLADKNDLYDFIYDFKITKAISILIQFSLGLNSNVSEKVILTCLNIINTNIKLLTCEYNSNKENEDINNLNQKSMSIVKLISDDDWNIISGEEKVINNNNNLKGKRLPPIQLSKNKQGLTDFLMKNNNLFNISKRIISLTNNNNNININSINNSKNHIINVNKKQPKKEESKNEESKNEISKTEEKTENSKNEKNKLKNDELKTDILKKNPEEEKFTEEESKNQISNPSKYLPQINILLKKLSENLPQYKMNGYHNIWIMKPSNLSRGREIHCINNLSKITKNLNETNNNIVLQKYIENPLIIHKKKFDIRQWVLITSIHPLTIWKWEEPYLRFSAENYDIENINNIYSHLTNNSIAKHSLKYNSENLIKEDMWDVNQFKNYLFDVYKKDLWNEINEKIKNAIICSFDCARHEIGYRENSHELYGYDFMIDDEFNVYLIEINSSPAMDYSTSITERLVKEMLGNIIQIVVDNKNNLGNCNQIGKYVKIYDGNCDVNEKFLPNK